jgi:hypothetical protein
MKMIIFLKTDIIKKGLENVYLSSGTNKSVSNFRETIPLRAIDGRRVETAS